jgi:hypothetical protein
VKLRHQDAEKCEYDVISQNIFAKNSKNRILHYFATRPKLQYAKKIFFNVKISVCVVTKYCTLKCSWNPQLKCFVGWRHVDTTASTTSCDDEMFVESSAFSRSVWI